MPLMKRFKGKATKIAYDVLGTPINMPPKKRKRSKKDKELTIQETNRVR